MAAANSRLWTSRSRSRIGAFTRRSTTTKPTSAATDSSSRPRLAGSRPAPLRGERERHQQGDEEDAEERRAGVVDARRIFEPLGPRQQEEAPQKRHQPDGQVDEEDRPPAERVDEEAAQRRTQAQPQVHGHDVDAEGAAALVRREHRGDDRGRGREHQGAPDALDDAATDEPGAVHAERREQRAQREDDDAEQVEAHAAVLVGQPANGNQQDGRRQQVGGLHPHRRREAEVEVLSHAGQGNGDDGPVERGHEGADGRQRQELPAAPVGILRGDALDQAHETQVTSSSRGARERSNVLAGASRSG